MDDRLADRADLPGPANGAGTARMVAAIYARYGPPDVVELRELERPIPSRDQVLVRVHAASVIGPTSTSSIPTRPSRAFSSGCVPPRSLASDAMSPGSSRRWAPA